MVLSALMARQAEITQGRMLKVRHVSLILVVAGYAALSFVDWQ
jgi:hypothetical protein